MLNFIKVTFTPNPALCIIYDIVLKGLFVLKAVDYYTMQPL